MNFSKITSPDFFIGKTLGVGKAVLDLTILLFKRPGKDALRFAARVFRVKPKYTMVGAPRLFNLHALAQTISNEGILGDVVECGVWNGGSSAIMAEELLRDIQHPGTSNRDIYLFDSFEGLPEPSPKDGQATQEKYYKGRNTGQYERVLEIHKRFQTPQENLHIIKGWYEDTFPEHAEKIEKIALLHCDADFYESVKIVLETFFDRVSPGGYVVLDDYFSWQGCRVATDEFLENKQLEEIELLSVPGGKGAYFQKPIH